MRILVVTSQFPLACDPTRGRPIHQTIRELSRLADVRLISPVARYPRWAQPHSYLFREPDAGPPAADCDVEYVTYPALPGLSRPLNGWMCARAIARPAERFAPDVVLAYWLYPDAFGAWRVARRLGAAFVAGARGHASCGPRASVRAGREASDAGAIAFRRMRSPLRTRLRSGWERSTSSPLAMRISVPVRGFCRAGS